MTPKAMLTTIAVATALLVVPSTASAASSVYAPDQDARTFSDNVAGWTATDDSSGACVQSVLCPAITNSYESAGGNDRGDGFIRTAVSSLTGVGGTTTGTWTSPSFVYKGVDGADPDSLGLTLARRADVGELLSVAGNSATFDVELVGVTRKADSVTVLESRSLADADGWSEIRQVDIAPNQLEVGQRYQIAITTTYRTGATVVPGGSADYDNVVLKAKNSSTGDEGTGDGTGGSGTGDNGDNGGTGGGGAGDGSDTGGNGGDGGGAAGGAGGGADSALAGSGVAGKSATLTDQGKLRVKVRCGRKAGANCKMRITGLVSKRGAKVGKAKKVTVKKGHSKVITLHVKPALTAQLASSKRIYVRQQVKADGHKAKKVVRLKLRHG